MTREIQQLLQQNKYGHGYRELNRDNYSEFFPELEAGPADVAHNILDKTLNKPSLLPQIRHNRLLAPAEGDPTSCFELQDLSAKSIVKSVAAQAINEYGLREVGFIDIEDSVQTAERARNTTNRIQQLGRAAAMYTGCSTLVTVEAGNHLSEEQSEAAHEIYGSLSQLSPQNFRVAILGTSDA